MPDIQPESDSDNKIKRLMEDQEKSARLLVRRDLELTRANERLRALDQMKTDFIAVATHQLRTPLSAIRWTLSMLLRGDAGPLNEEQRSLIVKAYESNDRMLALLSDLLLSDQVQSGAFKDLKATTLIPDLPEDLLIEIRPIAAKKQIEVQFLHPEASYAAVNIDPNQLRAILQNLLENAIKYSKPGTVVTMEVTQTDRSMIFKIADAGIGIPKEQQGSIFKRFFRAPNAVKIETDGTGLGLFIAKSIVERNQGKISFDSVEGKGTTFRVELPIANQ
jgi:signal transduction histidine kinase